MQSLVVEILNPDTVQAIADAARLQGTTPEACAVELLETALLARRPFEEIVEPIARDFDEGGLTEAELDELIKRARRAVRDESGSKK
ncbi:MAG TPA: hypothetical protein VN937_01660 [Blastocatellia bacterium]|nr:hypothetical protein [Blastocatellia bacterium]